MNDWLAYCEKYSHDARIGDRATFIAEEIDRRFPEVAR